MTSLNFVLQRDKALRLLNESSIQDVLNVLKADTEGLEAEITALEDALEFVRADSIRNAGLSGSLVQTTPPPENVSAATLNAAAAGSFRRTFEVDLTTLTGLLHTWYSLLPLLTGTYIGAGTASAPTFEGIPTYSGGILSTGVIFDTGPGIVYLAGESVTVDVQVQASNLLLGWPVPMVTKTYNVI